MTVVRVRLFESALGGSSPVPVGFVRAEPFAGLVPRVDVSADVVTLPRPLLVHVSDGDPHVTVDLEPTGPSWLWRITVGVQHGPQLVRNVTVPPRPDSIDFADLVDVDPYTMIPTPEAIPEWAELLAEIAAALTNIRDDRVAAEAAALEAEGSAVASASSESAAQIASASSRTDALAAEGAAAVAVAAADGVVSAVDSAVDSAVAAVDIPGKVAAQLELQAGPLIKGRGFPNGQVAAPVGTLYSDTEVTTGASLWQKISGTDTSGWVVVRGDTGVRNCNSLLSKLHVSFSLPRIYKLSRMGDVVTMVLSVTHFGSLIIESFPQGFTPWEAHPTLAVRGGTSMTVATVSAAGVRVSDELTGQISLTAIYTTRDPWRTTTVGTN